MGAGDEVEGVYVIELGSINRERAEEEQKKEELHTSRVTELPNNQPAPRGLTAQASTSSGSDHIRSENV